MKIGLSIAIIMLSLATGWGSTPSPPGDRWRHAIAGVNNLNPTSHNWDLNAEGVYCAKWDADKPYEWRSKYAWATICRLAGPKGQAACGKCLKVRDADTGNVAMVRVVDQCGSEGLHLDVDLEVDLVTFDLLNPGLIGHEAGGRLFVEYRFVDCGDNIMTDQSAESKNILVSGH